MGAVGERAESVGKLWAMRSIVHGLVHTARRARPGPKDSSTSPQASLSGRQRDTGIAPIHFGGGLATVALVWPLVVVEIEVSPEGTDQLRHERQELMGLPPESTLPRDPYTLIFLGMGIPELYSFRGVNSPDTLALDPADVPFGS